MMSERIGDLLLVSAEVGGGIIRSPRRHVSVQKFTATTRRRRSAGPSGSVLSHAVAPPSNGHVDTSEDGHLATRRRGGTRTGFARRGRPVPVRGEERRQRREQLPGR